MKYRLCKYVLIGISLLLSANSYGGGNQSTPEVVNDTRGGSGGKGGGFPNVGIPGNGSGSLGPGGSVFSSPEVRQRYEEDQRRRHREAHESKRSQEREARREERARDERRQAELTEKAKVWLQENHVRHKEIAKYQEWYRKSKPIRSWEDHEHSDEFVDLFGTINDRRQTYREQNDYLRIVVDHCELNQYWYPQSIDPPIYPVSHPAEMAVFMATRAGLALYDALLEIETVRQAGGLIHHFYVRTRNGRTYQKFNKEALTARKAVKDGAKLYRLGTRKISDTGDNAQYWSLENPQSADYAARYGLPAENGENPNFIEIGRLKKGKPFVTGIAPPAADGKNPGGGIQVVVPKRSVEIESHLSL